MRTLPVFDRVISIHFIIYDEFSFLFQMKFSPEKEKQKKNKKKQDHLKIDKWPRKLYGTLAKLSSQCERGYTLRTRVWSVGENERIVVHMEPCGLSVFSVVTTCLAQLFSFFKRKQLSTGAN